MPRESLNIRIRPEDRQLIDKAADLLGKTRTDFLVEAAKRAAEDALMDRTVFTVSEESYEEFRRRLDEPAPSNDKLHRMMNTPAPWE